MAGGAFLYLISSQAWAEEGSPLHWSGKQTLWNRKTNQVELIGDAAVRQEGELLKADHILLDLNERHVDAVGNCEYYTGESIVRAEEMHFDLETHAGTIIGGKVSNGKFVLSGERINKLGENEYQTHQAEYTTCRDCPAAWSLFGEDVDLEFEGYAFMKNVTAKVNDTPIFWFPYLIVPLKTKRTTGLLFPRFGGGGNHGFRFVLPFFWAINRSADMTVGAGVYTFRGFRGEWQGRYRLSDWSAGSADFFYTRDRTSDAPAPNRYGMIIEQSQELPWGIREKFRFLEVSDSEYPVDFSNDIPGRTEPVLTSDLIFSHSAAHVSSYVAMKRYRNLLNFDEPTRFDSKTVQLLPRVAFTTNSRPLFGLPLVTNLSVDYSNFTRTESAFDRNPDSGITSGPFVPGVDPIREASRFSLIPKISVPVRLFDVVSVIPSVEYRAFYYHFYNSLRPLNRGFLLFQTEISTQFERIYQFDDPEIPRVKHLIRPTLRYSRIPVVAQPDHPFLDQIALGNGYNFDNRDLVPQGNTPSLINYFIPLGHSLSYGVLSQWIRKRRDDSSRGYRYQRIWETEVSQALNILEFKKEQSVRVPLTRFEFRNDLTFDQLGWSTQYYYYPFLDRIPNTSTISSSVTNPSPHELSSQLTFFFEKGFHQGVFEFDRSFSFGYAWSRLNSITHALSAQMRFSINDYFLPEARATYDLINGKFNTVNGALSYQSPSRCWTVKTSLGYAVDQNGVQFDFSLGLNLTGDGFGSGSLGEQLEAAS
tara:strand:- start:1697 stop:3976 length:2280 start_codon:yes stop_codon:yes gene_type:complete